MIAPRRRGPGPRGGPGGTAASRSGTAALGVLAGRTEGCAHPALHLDLGHPGFQPLLDGRLQLAPLRGVDAG
ncbi:hypothetical protein [Streptomyces sp. NPDC000405]|uniref:hypothetical protein n=1 Tax=Streptomyces sp. NPDC000405 TaxID=3161033 RepID=UPI00398D5F77